MGFRWFLQKLSIWASNLPMKILLLMRNYQLNKNRYGMYTQEMSIKLSFLFVPFESSHHRGKYYATKYKFKRFYCPNKFSIFIIFVRSFIVFIFCYLIFGSQDKHMEAFRCSGGLQINLFIYFCIMNAIHSDPKLCRRFLFKNRKLILNI